MGSRASRSVLGVGVPERLVERNWREGVFGVIGWLSYRRGRRESALLGIAHPGAAWLEWLGPAPERPLETACGGNLGLVYGGAVGSRICTGSAVRA